MVSYRASRVWPTRFQWVAASCRSSSKLAVSRVSDLALDMILLHNMAPMNPIKKKPGPIPQPVHERFWAYVEKSGECWVWTGQKNRAGYGIFRLNQPRTKVLAHRYAWFLTYGPIPEGLHVCHHCDNPSCERPTHFFLGTDLDNHRDKVAKGRQTRGETHGPSKLTEDIVRFVRLNPHLSLSVLARSYSVSRSCLLDVRRHKTWTHIL